MRKPPSEVRGIEVGVYAETGLGTIVVRVDEEITKFFTPMQALKLGWALIRAVRETVRPHKRSIVCCIHDDLNAIEGQP